MAGGLPFDAGGGGDDEQVPLKLMLFVGVIAVFGALFFFVALAIDRKPLRAGIDPSDPAAFEQNDADLQETPDLWVQKKPGIPPPPNNSALPSPFDSSLSKPLQIKSLAQPDGSQQQQQPTSKPS